MLKRELNPGTVLVPCPVALVSVGDEKEKNIITISWTANVSSRPPRMAISIVPKRHSFGLLKRIEDFVINIPSKDLIEAAVTCGTKSGRSIDKFRECNFSAEPSSKITSPRIAECPLNIECKTWKVIEVGSHHLFIGDVVAVHIDEDVLDAEGEPDLKKFTVIAFMPLTRQYWTVDSFLRAW